MNLDRLVIESDDDGWVQFRRPSIGAGAFSREWFKLPNGFTSSDIRAAVQATGWVVARNGELWIEDHVGCQRLAKMAEQMCSYFDRSGEPSLQLLNIKQLVDAHLEDANAEDRLGIPLWAYAWLDVVLREDLADEASSANHLWNESLLTINVDQHRTRLINELGERYSEPARAMPRLAGSARSRIGVNRRSSSAG